MAQHTPGPWHTDPARDEMVVVDAADRLVADCCAFPEPPGGEAEIVANARLVASAPDMLAALERSLDWLASYPGGGTLEPGGPYEQARAAIAKARGAA